MMRHVTWFVRRLMLALILTLAAVQPAAAQQILRDSETEKLFNDMSKPLIEGAQLDPKNVRIVLHQRSRDQRFRCGRADRLRALGPDHRRRQRQPGAGRHRA
jgi:hypothetical protein